MNDLFNASEQKNEELRANAVNVLTLGAKNDGSEDVSEIVNRYTEKYALFFPAGRYKVSNPLVIKNPIFGEGYARERRFDDGHTWLVSDIRHENTDPLAEHGVIEFGGGGCFTVENLNIRCAEHECGIYINPCVQATSTFINKVGIYEVRGYGLLATKGDDVPGFASRPLFLQNMTILGTSDHSYPSVGIQLGARIGDNRFANIEIMGTRIGIWQEASFVYATNVHVWTGCIGQRDDGKWWETTRSLVLGRGDANFFGDNIYFDTSYVLVEMTCPRNMLSINNFMSWEDASIGGCDKKDARMFKIPDGMTEYPSINITNGLIYISGHDGAEGKFSDLTAPIPNARIQNVRILNNYSVNYENYKRLTLLRTDTPSYNGIAHTAETDKYVRIAAVAMDAPGGSCEFVYTDNSGDRADFAIVRKSGKTELDVQKSRLCEHEFYVKREENFMTFYVKTVSGEPELCYNIRTNCASDGFFPLDLGMLKNISDYSAKVEILNSADGLVKIDN